MYSYEKSKNKEYPLKKSASNSTGIPNSIKQQYEKSSGFSFDDVRIHYNSDKPNKLKALAYTQGNHIYMKSGQEKYLGHELSHVIQQKQGLVKPTANANGLPINDDLSLESNADRLVPLQKKSYANYRNETKNVIQMIGERNAIRHTMKKEELPHIPQSVYEESKGEDSHIFSNQIRRGNVENSLILTRAQSAVIVQQIRNTIESLYKDFKIAFNTKLTKEYKTLIEGKLVLLAGAGNCNEFASVIFSNLVSNTKNQWVYLCYLIPRENFDHAFSITSKIELNKGKIPTTIDLNKINVVDAWYDNTICTLKQYCDKEHPYFDIIGPLKSTNIKIVRKLKANPENGLNKKESNFIEQWFRENFPKPPPIMTDEKLLDLLEKQEECIIREDEDINQEQLEAQNQNITIQEAKRKNLRKKIQTLKPTPSTIKDLRPDELQLEDLDKENISVIINLLKQNKTELVASKLKTLDQKLLEYAIIELLNITYDMPLLVHNLMNLLDFYFLDRISDNIIHKLFYHYNNNTINHKGNYIKYLWGTGFNPNKPRINKLLISNKEWTLEFINGLPNSGWFTFKQTDALPLAKDLL